jgi:hypothetical protein
MEINDLDGDGFKEILLGGTNAGSREAALVVLDRLTEAVCKNSVSFFND